MLPFGRGRVNELTCNFVCLQELMNLIGPKFGPMKSVSLEKITLACIWYLGNTEAFRSVTDKFGMSKGMLHLGQFSNIFKDQEILKSLISWPTADIEFCSLADKFSQRVGFPNAVGAIDGTYIPIT